MYQISFAQVDCNYVQSQAAAADVDCYDGGRKQLLQTTLLQKNHQLFDDADGNCYYCVAVGVTLGLFL